LIGKFRNRSGEILFIDARNYGHLINRRTRELSSEDIQKIAETYHNWRNPDRKHEKIKSFCNSTPIDRGKELDYVLTPWDRSVSQRKKIILTLINVLQP
jgi:type I restriction enzyme M protein